MWGSRTPPTGSRLAPIGVLAVTSLLVACAAPTVAPPSSSSSASPVMVTASPLRASPSSVPVVLGSSFPPSQTTIEPGTYHWDGFEPPISLSLGEGWELGHDDPAFFDLFRGSDFPSVSFARFTDVYVDPNTRSPASDAATVTAALSARPDLVLSEPTGIDLGGLAGVEFDLATVAPRTPVFFGPAGDFRLEPEFKTRYRVLDVPGGGILVIGIHDRAAAFDAAITLAEPVVTSVEVVSATP